MKNPRTHEPVGPAIWTAPAFVLLAGLVVLLSRSFLFYEGSEIFVFPAEYGLAAPMFEKPLRVAWMLLQTPVLVARWLTSDLGLLSFVFGAPFALLPAAAVLFVVMSLRQRPAAAAVALIGMCLAPLPWQLFSVSQWSMVNQLSWVLLACIVRRHEVRRLGVLVPWLAGFLFFTHPLSCITFLALGVGLRVVSTRTSRSGRNLAWASGRIAPAFALLGVLRLALVFAESTEAQRVTDLVGVSRHELVDGFHHAGAAFVGLYLMLLVASAAALAQTRVRSRAPSVGLQIAAALSLSAYFATNPRPWLQGLDYHYWTFAALPAFVLVFLVLAARDSRARPAAPPHGLGTASVIVPSLVYLVVMAAGSSSYHAEMLRLREAAARTGNACVELGDLPPEFSSSPAHAFVFSNNLLATGGVRRPTHVLLAGTCAHACWTPSPDEHHLFDFSALPHVDPSGGPCATTMSELIR